MSRERDIEAGGQRGGGAERGPAAGLQRDGQDAERNPGAGLQRDEEGAERNSKADLQHDEPRAQSERDAGGRTTACRDLVPVGSSRTAGSALVQYEQQRIGAILLADGKISHKNVQRVLRVQGERREQKFGEVAIRLKLVSERDVQSALCRQYGYPPLDSLERQLSPELYMALAPFSRPAELLNKILGQLLLVQGAQPLAIAVASPDPADGRSNLAANLALACAHSGKRTLLIDADLRKPRQHRLFGFENSFGLTSMVRNANGHAVATDELETAAPRQLFGLSVICSGPPEANPIRILMADRFAHLIQAARAAFQTIIIDTPAARAYADAEAIAALAGNALVVARENRTRIGDVQALIDTSARRGFSVLGTVLTRP